MDHAPDDAIEPPDVSGLVTEDDAPVESLFQEKQMRLLVEPLYSSWRPTRAGEVLPASGSDDLPSDAETASPTSMSRSFVAAADVGIFGSVHERAIVPDTLLSMDVTVPDEFWRKDKRSYYAWEFGKMPEVVVEIVSNREGDELGAKRAIYSKLRIAHYVVYDHLRLYGEEPLHVFELRGDLLIPSSTRYFPSVGLGLTLWSGEFETKHAIWLRWCDAEGGVIPTGEERARREEERAEHEAERAEREADRASRAAERAEREAERAEREAERAEREADRAAKLAEQLRKLGIEPEDY